MKFIDIQDIRRKALMWLSRHRRLIVLAILHAALIDFVYLLALNETGYLILALGFIANAILTSAIFYWISCLPFGKTLIIPATVSIDLAVLYAGFHYRLPIDPNSVAFLVETDFSEAHEFIVPAMLAWAIGSFLGGVLVHFYLRRAALVIPKYVGLLGCILCLVIGYALWKPRGTVDPRKYQGPMPMTLAMAVAGYVTDRVDLRMSTASRTDISKLPYSKRGDDVEVILIIGESARGASFQLNGYDRKNNPQLSTLGVINFPQAESCDASTRISVPCLLTRATTSDHANLGAETSLVSVFREMGYQTAWFSNQRRLGLNDSLVFSFADEAAYKYFSTNTYAVRTDADILPTVLAYIDGEAPRSLTVVHTIGSHWNYVNRYPKDFEAFSPACSESDPRSCELDNVINAYDNSILYSDFFISSIIRKMENRAALVAYVSDHGESLGEDGFYFHGNPSRPEQRWVPLIVWTSEKFKERFGARVHALTEGTKAHVGHDNIFHTLLGCAGIHGSVVDESLDLCEARQ